MHRDTLNTKYDADAQVKRLVRSMGKTFQKLSANKKFFLLFFPPPKKGSQMSPPGEWCPDYISHTKLTARQWSSR